MLHRSYLCSIARPAIHSHPKTRHAVPSPRISEWTRVDMTRSTLSRTHSVTEAAAPTTVVAAASPCPLDKSGSISDTPGSLVVTARFSSGADVLPDWASARIDLASANFRTPRSRHVARCSARLLLGLLSQRGPGGPLRRGDDEQLRGDAHGGELRGIPTCRTVSGCRIWLTVGSRAGISSARLVTSPTATWSVEWRLKSRLTSRRARQRLPTASSSAYMPAP